MRDEESFKWALLSGTPPWSSQDAFAAALP
ncbi:hypothetical protein BH23GEM8_BH23GEM8_16220 [soil metagenome]